MQDPRQGRGGQALLHQFRDLCAQVLSPVLPSQRIRWWQRAPESAGGAHLPEQGVAGKAHAAPGP
eukprot:10835957-Lingulodinium_polyedra.AAC.1